MNIIETEAATTSDVQTFPGNFRHLLEEFAAEHAGDFLAIWPDGSHPLQLGIIMVDSFVEWCNG